MPDGDDDEVVEDEAAEAEADSMKMRPQKPRLKERPRKPRLNERPRKPGMKERPRKPRIKMRNVPSTTT